MRCVCTRIGSLLDCCGAVSKSITASAVVRRGAGQQQRADGQQRRAATRRLLLRARDVKERVRRSRASFWRRGARAETLSAVALKRTLDGGIAPRRHRGCTRARCERQHAHHACAHVSAHRAGVPLAACFHTHHARWPKAGGVRRLRIEAALLTHLPAAPDQSTRRTTHTTSTHASFTRSAEVESGAGVDRLQQLLPQCGCQSVIWKL
jgi:hypothetical protein